MIIKFHIEQSDRGMILLEMPPQKRMVQLTGNKVFRQMDFDYTLFTISYYKSAAGFVYPGLNGSGLRVFSSPKSLESINDEVDFLSIESERFGLSCTPHHYDHKAFPTLKELVESIIGLWWNSTHFKEPLGAYSYVTLSNYDDQQNIMFKCSTQKKYFQKVENSRVEYHLGGTSVMNLPKEIEIINKPWS